MPSHRCIYLNEKIFVFWLKFHWSLFPRVLLTESQHWCWQWLGAEQATSHKPQAASYLSQWLTSLLIHLNHQPGFNEWKRATPRINILTCKTSVGCEDPVTEVPWNPCFCNLFILTLRLLGWVLHFSLRRRQGQQEFCGQDASLATSSFSEQPMQLFGKNICSPTSEEFVWMESVPCTRNLCQG